MLSDANAVQGHPKSASESLDCIDTDFALSYISDCVQFVHGSSDITNLTPAAPNTGAASCSRGSFIPRALSLSVGHSLCTHAESVSLQLQFSDANLELELPNSTSVNLGCIEVDSDSIQSIDS
jgi:hypothetical protein